MSVILYKKGPIYILSKKENSFDHPVNLILTVPRLFLPLSIQQPIGENFFISLRISRCFVVLMQKKKTLAYI